MMLSQRGQNILKVLHLLAACIWVGACFCLLALWFYGPVPQSGEELFGLLKAHNFLAFVVAGNIGACGTFFTGLAYSLCTNRGFFRHKWLVLKWAITLASILFGYFGFVPLNTELLEQALRLGVHAPGEPAYQVLAAKYELLAVTQAVLLLLALVLSVYKPWEKTEVPRAAGRRRG
jgi:uncharacterized membrane protein